MKKDMEILKADLQMEMQGLKADLQKEIRLVSNNTIKWVAGFLVGQTALLFTLIKLFA